MKRTWMELYAGETFMMKVIKFGKWRVEFGMNVNHSPKGWDFKKVIKDWSAIYYHGHIGKVWYDNIEVMAVNCCDQTRFLTSIYKDWERAKK